MVIISISYYWIHYWINQVINLITNEFSINSRFIKEWSIIILLVNDPITNFMKYIIVIIAVFVIVFDLNYSDCEVSD